MTAQGTGKLRSILFIAFMLVGSLAPGPRALAAESTVLFSYDGSSKAYLDRGGMKYLSGTAAFSTVNRAFGPRVITPLRSDPVLNGFPYGAYGIDETNNDADYTDAGDVDPLKLMDQMRADGVYNVALSSKLGSGIRSKDKIIRTLEGAQARGLKLITRALVWKTDGTYAVDVTATETVLKLFQDVFAQRPDLAPSIYAWYSYDEPLSKGVPLSELQKAYSLHKKYFPTVKVFTVFNQNQNITSTCPDADNDGISDCMLGEARNRYSAGVADIVGLNIYPAVAMSSTDPRYGYDTIRKLYAHGRRVVDSVNALTPIWGVAQAHGLVLDPSNMPEAHQMYRQVNDWLRAGPDLGIRGVDGLLWYSWHFPPASVQQASDLDSNPPLRRMARLIGTSVKSRSAVAHGLPYEKALYQSASPSSVVYAPRVGNMLLDAGTITLSVSRAWAGDDGRRHVLLDTGVSGVKDRLLVEKTAGNVLRIVVTDSYGKQKWTGISVDKRNMAGSRLFPGYSDIAVTWSNGVLALYLDGVRGALNGGTGGTGKLGSGGARIYFGTDMSGSAGADAAFRYVTIRSQAGTSASIDQWGLSLATAASPVKPALVSPANAASTTDRTPTLTWSRDSISSSSQLQVATSSTFSTTSMVRRYSSTGLSYTLPTALTAGRVYYWRVRSCDSYGCGAWSAYRSVKIN